MKSFVHAVGMNSSREDCPRRWKRKNPRISVSRVVRVDERFCGGCGLPYGKATAGVFRFYVEEDSAEEDVAL